MAHAHYLEFAPPPTRGLLRSVALALVAHSLLLVALTAGIQWNHEVVVQSVEAELWSSIPAQAAAPAAPETPPEPPVQAEPVPTPEAPPAPPPPAPLVQDHQAADAAIAVAREKAKRLKAEKAANEKAAKEKAIKDKALKEQALKDKAVKEKAAKDKAAKEKAAQDKLAADKAAKDKQRKQQDSKAQQEQKRKQDLADAKEAKQLDELRTQNLKRIAGMAGGGGNGAANSTGTALRDSGPSAGYAGRIVARIKPNIVFTEDVRGNPRVEVEIRTSPSGAILSTRITQGSGVKSWDEAVVRAIEKTETLPKDIDGNIPTSMQIGFRPKD